MKIRSIVPTEFLVTTKRKGLRCASIEKGWYRIVDDSGERIIFYPPEMFEVVEE